ncbi:MAG: S1/P1 nuclease [Paludibacteraceae bacterium]|nr:S1/P1 nuclease [Paludibacteraceae bacterium]
MTKRYLSLLLILVTISSYPYDNVGHRIISEVAYRNMTKKACKQTDKILGVKGIVYESSWADEIRSDENYKYSYQWHYQNLKDGMNQTDLKALIENPTKEGEHLFYAIDLMIKRLKKDKADAEALKFLVHFIGDLHQPMHLGRVEDLGGNRVKINWFGRNTNIHSVWDGQITDSRKLSYSEYADFVEDKFSSNKKKYTTYNMLASVEETYMLRNEVYAWDAGNTNNYHYLYKFTDDLDLLFYRAGIYLSVVLNDIYR